MRCLSSRDAGGSSPVGTKAKWLSTSLSLKCLLVKATDLWPLIYGAYAGSADSFPSVPGTVACIPGKGIIEFVNHCYGIVIKIARLEPRTVESPLPLVSPVKGKSLPSAGGRAAGMVSRRPGLIGRSCPLFLFLFQLRQGDFVSAHGRQRYNDSIYRRQKSVLQRQPNCKLCCQ